MTFLSFLYCTPHLLLKSLTFQPTHDKGVGPSLTIQIVVRGVVVWFDELAFLFCGSDRALVHNKSVWSKIFGPCTLHKPPISMTRKSTWRIKFKHTLARSELTEHATWGLTIAYSISFLNRHLLCKSLFNAHIGSILLQVFESLTFWIRPSMFCQAWAISPIYTSGFNDSSTWQK